jgi:hypothetical protein
LTSESSANTTPVPSRRASVTDVDDDEPRSVGGSLRADGDIIMESSDGETEKSVIELSDNEDMDVHDSETELSECAMPGFVSRY